MINTTPEEIIEDFVKNVRRNQIKAKVFCFGGDELKNLQDVQKRFTIGEIEELITQSHKDVILRACQELFDHGYIDELMISHTFGFRVKEDEKGILHRVKPQI